MRRLLLLSLAVVTGACQAQPPPTPPLLQGTPTPTPTISQTPALTVPAQIKQWTVERTFKMEARGPSHGYTVTISSDGNGLVDYWEGGSAVGFKAQNQHKKIKVTAPDLAKLTKALKDPELARQLAGGSDTSNGLLTVTLNGMPGTFRSEDDHYAGAAGRLAATLYQVKPWPTR